MESKPNFLRQTNNKKLSTKIFSKLLVDNGILSNFLTTQYEEVLSYLKEMKKYFLDFTNKKNKLKTESFKTNNLDANHKVNIELNKIKSSNNIELNQQVNEDNSIEENFIYKIDYIIEAIQSQNLYEYNNLQTGGDFLKDEESSEDVDSFIGFLSNYSNFKSKTNKPKPKFSTTKATKNPFLEIIDNKKSTSFAIPNKYTGDLVKTENLLLDNSLSFKGEIKEEENTEVYEANSPSKDHSIFHFAKTESEYKESIDNSNNAKSSKEIIKIIPSNSENDDIDKKNEIVKIIPNIEESNLKMDRNDLDPISQNFNILKYAKEKGENGLIYTVLDICLNEINKFPIDIDSKENDLSNIIDFSRLKPFTFFVQEKYIKNPYHNHVHGADVFHNLFVILYYSQISKKVKFNSYDISAILLSGLLHDIGHMGFNNNFMINSKSELSLIYNDINVLENYHASEGYKAIQKYDLLKLEAPRLKTFRQRLISMIIATDPVNHSKVNGLIKNKLANKIDEENQDSIKCIINEQRLIEDQQDLMNFFISFSDTAHSCKDFEITFEWTSRLMEEFWHQGDIEKKLELPVSFLCERNDSYVGKGQIGFIQVIILPTVNTMLSICPKLSFFMDKLDENIIKWTNYLEEKEKSKLK